MTGFLSSFCRFPLVRPLGGVLPRVTAAQGGNSVAVEFIAVERAAGHGHDQGQGSAGHEWPGAGGEGAVGGREPEAADASLGEDDEIGTLVVVSYCGQGGDRVVMVDAERPTDVLAVHDGFTEHRYGRQGRFGRAGD